MVSRSAIHANGNIHSGRVAVVSSGSRTCKAPDDRRRARTPTSHPAWDGGGNARAPRAKLLSYVAMLPWVRVPHLASHLLGRITRRLSEDWRRKYGHPIYLLETFVDTSRIPGTCYRGRQLAAGGTDHRTHPAKQIP